MLEKREDFYAILSVTLKKWQIPETSSPLNEDVYVANKYLNFVAHPNLPDRIFSNLIAEYSHSSNFWKSILQKIYVKLAVHAFFRKLFAHQSILLPIRYSDKLILGGNHRLRIFNSSLSASTVILKQGEAKEFIKNEINVRKNYSLDYAPSLLDYGKDWLKEEYITGLPLNRINNNSQKQAIIPKLINTHLSALTKASIKYITKEEYVHRARQKSR